MNRTESRKNAMIIMYQCLLKKITPFDVLTEEVDNDLFIPPFDVDEYFDSILYEIQLHQDEYIEMIDQQLSDWSFNRLGYIEQAILMVAYAELQAGQTERAIVIDQAIELTKIYGEETSYKLINGTLDHL